VNLGSADVLLREYRPAEWIHRPDLDHNVIVKTETEGCSSQSSEVDVTSARVPDGEIASIAPCSFTTSDHVTSSDQDLVLRHDVWVVIRVLPANSDLCSAVSWVDTVCRQLLRLLRSLILIFLREFSKAVDVARTKSEPVQ
jgi:hypothetical protein